MTTTTTSPRLAARDTATMVRRQLRHARRYPSMTVMLVAFPVVFLLLFVYVLGGTLGAGLTAGGTRADYIGFVAPGILLMTVASTVTGTAVGVASDMTEGVVARFRSMAVFRPSVLAGHVIGGLVQALVAVVAVLGVALLVGFRPDAGVGEWLAALGLIALFAHGLIWLAVALGLAAGSVETASNLPLPLVLLPFLGSGFVPATSMPTALRWFADVQPFTPVIDTVRGLLTGTPVGGSAVAAVAWSVVLTLGAFAWSVRLYERRD